MMILRGTKLTEGPFKVLGNTNTKSIYVCKWISVRPPPLVSRKWLIGWGSSGQSGVRRASLRHSDPPLPRTDSRTRGHEGHYGTYDTRGTSSVLKYTGDAGCKERVRGKEDGDLPNTTPQIVRRLRTKQKGDFGLPVSSSFLLRLRHLLDLSKSKKHQPPMILRGESRSEEWVTDCKMINTHRRDS